MSKSCAEKCEIMRLMDNRFAGTARGVGVQKISGIDSYYTKSVIKKIN